MKIPPLIISVQVLVPGFNVRRGYEVTRAYAETHLRRRGDQVPAIVERMCREVLSRVAEDHA